MACVGDLCGLGWLMLEDLLAGVTAGEFICSTSACEKSIPRGKKPECITVFTKASVTTYHKLGGLKQQKFVVSRFWRLQV